MFDVTERTALRERLVLGAEQDPDVVAAALVGSAARDAEDAWSDIDLALVLAPGASRHAVADRWTALVRADTGLVDHLDVEASGALYRVLLLPSTLQVDVSFWPHDGFVSGASPIRVLFGEVGGPGPERPVDDPADHLRRGWLLALHVRSALRRDRVWQAIWMLHALRDEVVTLACRRRGLPTHEGRGTDALPEDVRAELARTLPRGTDPERLNATFGVLVELLVRHAAAVGVEVSSTLEDVLAELVRTSVARPNPYPPLPG